MAPYSSGSFQPHQIVGWFAETLLGYKRSKFHGSFLLDGFNEMVQGITSDAHGHALLREGFVNNQLGEIGFKKVYLSNGTTFDYKFRLNCQTGIYEGEYSLVRREGMVPGDSRGRAACFITSPNADKLALLESILVNV